MGRRLARSIVKPLRLMRRMAMRRRVVCNSDDVEYYCLVLLPCIVCIVFKGAARPLRRLRRMAMRRRGVFNGDDVEYFVWYSCHASCASFSKASSGRCACCAVFQSAPIAPPRFLALIIRIIGNSVRVYVHRSLLPSTSIFPSLPPSLPRALDQCLRLYYPDLVVLSRSALSTQS